ncbi:hypothetical protein [Phenylobacterium sp.]|uniref:hypothetical protein n=1 Tax=Phenylobacterium sp. TaxID=1871053 RepID=UPI0035B353B5
MKNIQIIDDAANATFSIFQATDAEFAAIFPDGRDIEIAEDFFERLGEEKAGTIIEPIWERPILKRDALGIHGTIYYGWSERRKYLPVSKREVDLVDSDPWGINHAQRRLFAANR